MDKTDYTKQVLANLNLESKIIKNLTLTSNAPVWLAEGELAVNIIDKKLWVGNTLNTPVLILSPIMGADAGTLIGTTLAANVVNSSLTSVGTLEFLTVTNIIGGSISGNAATATSASTVLNPNLTGEVTTSSLTATVTNSAVIGKVLTGYVSGAGTVAATDTILQAIQKLNGNAGGSSGIIDGGFPSDNYSNIPTIDGGTP